jgi:hypothetical protein
MTVSTTPTTTTTGTASGWSLAGGLAVAIGFALQAIAGVFVSASGLIMPAWAIAATVTVWLTGLVVAIRHRRRPLVVLLVPVATMAVWLLTGWAGETFLGWTG